MLWWPNGHGYANLYRMRLQFDDGKKITDDTSVVFGIRTVSSKVEMVNGWAREIFM